MTELLFNPRLPGKTTDMMKDIIQLEGGTVLSECQKCQSKKLLSVSYRMQRGCSSGLKCADCGVLYMVKEIVDN